MEQFKIGTITKQSPRMLAQGGGKVILAEEGDVWYLDPIVTTEGGDNRAIIASSMGMLQVLAALTPVFKPGCNDLTGEVQLSPREGYFPWRFGKDDSGGYTITAREESIPDDVVLPAGGKVYLVWEAAEVKWVWSGGISPQAPPRAVWYLEKVVNEPVDDPLEQVKITLFTQECNLPRKSIARGDANRSVNLTKAGANWFLRSLPTSDNNDDAAKSKTNAILAPSLGVLQVLAQLAPIFRSTTLAESSSTTDTGCSARDKPPVERRGELGLSVAASGEEFPWVFKETAEGGVTISAAAPSELAFFGKGRVYLVWELPDAVKWQFSEGAGVGIPAGALWAVAPADVGGVNEEN